MRTPDYANQLVRVNNKFLFAARVIRTSFRKGVRKGTVVWQGETFRVIRNGQGIWESAA